MCSMPYSTLAPSRSITFNSKLRLEHDWPSLKIQFDTSIIWKTQPSATHKRQRIISRRLAAGTWCDDGSALTGPFQTASIHISSAPKRDTKCNIAPPFVLYHQSHLFFISISVPCKVQNTAPCQIEEKILRARNF